MISSAPEVPRKPGYWGNVWSAVKSTSVGLGITFRYLWSKPVTIQYPDEKLPTDDRYRGIHYLEQDLCIFCDACAKACPIDCIEMDSTRHGKEIEAHRFELDYQKCMFCELCVYPCPKDCIHMGKEYAFVTEDRGELLLDMLTWTGLTEEQKVRVSAAEAAKAAKAAAKAAKAAEQMSGSSSSSSGGEADPKSSSSSSSSTGEAGPTSSSDAAGADESASDKKDTDTKEGGS